MVGAQTFLEALQQFQKALNNYPLMIAGGIINKPCFPRSPSSFDFSFLTF